jgi:hypothetical protein
VTARWVGLVDGLPLLGVFFLLGMLWRSGSSGFTGQGFAPEGLPALILLRVLNDELVLRGVQRWVARPNAALSGLAVLLPATEASAVVSLRGLRPAAPAVQDPRPGVDRASAPGAAPAG